MLTEVEQALARLQVSGLSSSRAASDLRQLHDRYSRLLARIQNSASHPHVMRILAEEAVEELYLRLKHLGIPFEDEEGRPPPAYWLNYMNAVNSGELMDTEYSRFMTAQGLAGPFLRDSYVDEDMACSSDYKTQKYAYALSSGPMPAWFSPEGVLKRLEEIVTACGFLWFAVVDYAEEQYYSKGA